MYLSQQLGIMNRLMLERAVKVPILYMFATRPISYKVESEQLIFGCGLKAHIKQTIIKLKGGLHLEL